MFSIQTWLGESEDSQKSGGTPGYFSVGMSRMFSLPSIPREAHWKMRTLTELLLTMFWGEICSHGFGGDIFALVHSSSRCDDDFPASGTVAIKDGPLDVGSDCEERGILCS